MATTNSTVIAIVAVYTRIVKGLSQRAEAVQLLVQTVGIMGDGRTYEFVCALRAVTSA